MGLIFRDRGAYCNRLRSFKPNPNLARDLLLSPIILARFGWMLCATANDNDNDNVNVNDNDNDILECNECNQMIAVKFHEDLSPGSHLKLALAYRNMLASKHLDTCPYAMDAKRWLILNPQQHQQQHQHQQDVPHYMIPMSDEYQVMEDCTDSGFVTTDFILRQALKLKNTLDLLPPPPDDDDDDNVTDNATDTDATPPPLVTNIQLHIRDDIITNIQKIVTLSLSELCRLINEASSAHSQKIHTTSNLTTEIVLLSLFGWRDMEMEMDTDLVPVHTNTNTNTNQDLDDATATATSTGQLPPQSSLSFLHVRCRMCLNQCRIPCTPALGQTQTDHDGICNRRDLGRSNPNKRRRIDQIHTTIDTDATTPTFDLINSHRHYCPMTCGFIKDASLATLNNGNATNTDTDTRDGAVSMTKPGWEIFLSSLYRGIQKDSTGDATSRSSANASTIKFDGAKVLEKIRESLRPTALRVLHQKD